MPKTRLGTSDDATLPMVMDFTCYQSDAFQWIVLTMTVLKWENCPG